MAEDRPIITSPGPRGFAARVGTVLLIVSLFVALVLALWKASQVLLLMFAGVLLAVILRTASNAVARLTKLRSRWALTLVLVVVVALAVVGGWLAAPSVAMQVQQLRENLNNSIEALTSQVSQLPGGEEVVAVATEPGQTITNGNGMWERVAGVFSSTLGALTGALIILAAGIFLAYDPKLYLSGFLRLVPLDKRRRTCEVFASLGTTLQGWLIGQLISMAFLFVTTWIMLALLGVPLALVLALLTGLATFVPYVGPLIALIPILMVAMVESPSLALSVGLLYMVIQNVEGNILMPLVFQRTVHLPPVLTIGGQLMLGAIFGVLGFILATPLTAVVMVLVQMLYVEDVLGDSMEAEVRETPELDGSA